MKETVNQNEQICLRYPLLHFGIYNILRQKYLGLFDKSQAVFHDCYTLVSKDMYYRCFLVILSILITSNTKAQSHLSLRDTIPLNPKVRHGVLSNGFSYYIFDNKNGENKLTINFVVNVGFNHEKEKESSVAHFIEHLSFRGVENFPLGVRRSLLDRGLGLGAASTRLGNTIYRIQIPANDSTLLEYGLLICRNFAKGRLYLQADVEEERAAVINEYAMSNTSDGRFEREGTFLLLDKNPIYASKLLDLPEKYINSLRNVSTETLRHFDDQWYRPNLEAIIVVGDLNELEVEKKVEILFSTLTNIHSTDSSSIDNYKQYDVPLTGKNKLIVINHEPSRPTVEISILQKRKTITQKGIPFTVRQFKIEIQDRLYNTLILQRLNSLRFRNASVPESLKHYIDRNAIHPFAGIDALTTSLKVNQISNIKMSIEFSISEIHRIQKWGFTKNEFASAKELLLRNFQQERSTLSSQSVASALLNHFSEKTAFPDNALEFSTKLLNEVSLNDINSMANDWIGDESNTYILFSVPNKNAASIPDEKQVFKWIKNAFNKNVRPYVETTLKSLPPQPVDVSRKFSRSTISEIGAVALELPNGVRVILKNLESTGKSVSLHGFRTGGTNLYNDVDYSSASLAAELVAASGISSLNNSEFKEWTREKIRKGGQLYITPYIDKSEEGFFGAASLSNMEDLLHLVYLYFKEPRKDKGAFNQNLLVNEQTKRSKSRFKLFNDSINNILTGEVTRKSTVPPKFEKTFAIYKERFSNARDFTFVIAGNFEMEDMIKLAVRYLGVLPNPDPLFNTQRLNKSNITSVTLKPSPMNIRKRVIMVNDSVSPTDVQLLFKGQVELTVRNQLVLDLIGRILNPLLFKRLRDQEKAIYSVTASSHFFSKKSGPFLRVQFETQPENVDRLSVAVANELNDIASGKLNNSSFNSAVAELLLIIAEDMRSPNYFIRYISNQLQQKIMSNDGLQREEILKTITRQDVVDLIRDSIDTKNYMLFELL